MRSIRRISSAVGLAVALGALAGATSASAATIGPAGTAFTGWGSGEQVYSITSSNKFRCNQAKFTGTTPSPATSSVSVTASFGAATGVSGAWCRWYVGGSYMTTPVTTSDPWTLTASSFNALDGTFTGTMTTGTMTTAIGATCRLTFPAGTTLNVSGLNDPEGLSLAMSAAYRTYTSTGCGALGIPATGSTGAYSGSVWVEGISVS